MKALAPRVAVLVGVVFAVWVPVVSPWLRGGYVHVDAHSANGRPNVWRTYDAQGRVIEEAIDSNADGRSDVREYYARGALVRRESDRNFDDRVDLVEEFDATTHQRARSVIDTDFDGTADLLVLFRDGQPVFSKSAPHHIGTGELLGRLRAAAPTRRGDAPIAQFSDPFARDTTVRNTPTTPDGSGSTWTAVALFVCPAPTTRGIRFASSRRCLDAQSTPASPFLGLRSSRGPPSTELYSA